VFIGSSERELHWMCTVLHFHVWKITRLKHHLLYIQFLFVLPLTAACVRRICEACVRHICEACVRRICEAQR
jgi:hypothetical protein